MPEQFVLDWFALEQLTAPECKLRRRTSIELQPTVHDRLDVLPSGHRHGDTGWKADQAGDEAIGQGGTSFCHAAAAVGEMRACVRVRAVVYATSW